MSAIARRLAALELASTPKIRPVLILTLCRAGKENSEPVSIDGLPFNREPGEAWNSYQTRAALWFEKNPGDSCLAVMKVRYSDDGDNDI